MFRVIEGSLSIVDDLGNVVSTISGINGSALQIQEQNVNSDGHIQSTAHTYGQYSGSWMPFALDDLGRLRIVSEGVAGPHTLSGTSHIGQLSDWQIPDGITRDSELNTVSGALQTNIDDHVSDVSIHREHDDALTTNTNLWSAEKISQEITTATGSLTADHGDLDGLGDDDHLHYHTDARGDARYYTELELDAGQLDNRYYTETEIDVHLNDTSNPHTVTLEQARVAGNTMIGPIIFNPPSNMTVIDVSGVNRDLIWMLGHDGSGYGYYWKYEGTGTGDTNFLYLYSENGAGADFWHLRYHQTTHELDIGSNLNFQGTYRAQFRDSAIYINSNSDGHLDINADVQVDVNSNLYVSGNFTLDGGSSVNIIRDEDDFGHDDANALITQQSAKAYVDTHTSNTNNPHSVTLEQARVAGNTISSNNRIYFRDTYACIYSNTSNELTLHGATQVNIDRDLHVNRDLYVDHRFLINGGSSVDVIRDEDDMAHDDANALVTQQSVKAYVDAHTTDVSIHREHDDALTTNTNLWSAEKISQEITTATGTLTTDHSALLNLDYASSGHTGFVSTATIQTITGAKTFSSDVNLDDNNLSNVQRVSFEQRTTDVSLPHDGDVWYRSDTDNIRVRADGLTNDVSFVKIIECYNTSVISVNVNTPVAISWGAEDFKDDLYTHSTVVNNSRVEVERTGIYEISYAVCIDNTANSRKTVRSRVRVNGTTYQRRGTCYSYSRNTTDDKQANTVTFPISLSANDYIEVMCDRRGSSGVANTISNESFIYIKLIRYV